MSVPLYKKKPNRIFAFGCSFTRYYWTMWPEILSLATGIPTFNYGKRASGNRFILNQIILANKYHKFTKDDLIIVVWTSLTRRDYVRKLEWVHDAATPAPGTEDESGFDYNSEFINQFALISSAMSMLDNIGCMVHHSCMDPMSWVWHTHWQKDAREKKLFDTIINTYSPEINRLLPSISGILWNTDYKARFEELEKIFGHYYMDAHPYPSETLKWLRTVFDFDFSSIEDVVHKHNNQLIEDIKTFTRSGDYTPHKDSWPGVNAQILDRYQVDRYIVDINDDTKIDWARLAGI